jgi:ABC-type transporter Mla subunit MlaD
MNYTDAFSIRPGEVSDATGQLTEFTDRIRQAMETEAPNLTVVASGRDEVSQRVATTLNEVHASFAKTSDQGGQQIQDVAGAVRTHTDKVVAVDQGLAL